MSGGGEGFNIREGRTRLRGLGFRVWQAKDISTSGFTSVQYLKKQEVLEEPRSPLRGLLSPYPYV